MTLFINTQNQKVVTVAIKDGKKIISELSEENQFGSQALLPLILKLLQAQNYQLQTLQGIEVATGPGSFVGLRVGVSVANALGFALDIPVNGKKIETNLTY